MSHELRTPLNAIIGFSEVMTHEMFGPVGSPRYLDYARVINESGGHLLELINGILDMSKIEAGKFELSEEIFNLGEVTEQAVRFVKIPYSAIQPWSEGFKSWGTTWVLYY